MLQNSRACFFWGRRSAAGSSDTDTKGLGILKSMNIHANHLYWFNKWQFVISTSIFWNHQICIRTYPMRGYLLTWYFINPSARGYLLTWYFINLGIAWIFINVDIFYSSDLSICLPEVFKDLDFLKSETTESYNKVYIPSKRTRDRTATAGSRLARNLLPFSPAVHPFCVWGPLMNLIGHLALEHSEHT